MSITSESGATRREFLRHATMAAATAGVAGAARRAHAANSPNARLRIGIIGCGGRSGAHVSSYDWVKSEGLPIEIAAVCDVYKPRRDRMTRPTSSIASSGRSKSSSGNARPTPWGDSMALPTA